LLRWAPNLSHIVHFEVLLVCTTAMTIAVSTVRYRWLEFPGIHAGRFLAMRLTARREGVPTSYLLGGLGCRPQEAKRNCD